MGVREKLIELLDIIIQPGQKTLGDIADYLINNGVTVQECVLEDLIAEFIKAHKWGEKYSAVDFYDWHHRITGSCEMVRKEFAESHGYSLTEEELLTVEEFIELTKDSYCGSVIRKLREAYGRDER